MGLESEVGVGAKVRARGFGVFAEGSPRRSLRASSPKSEIEVADIERVVLDELAAWLDLVAH